MNQPFRYYVYDNKKKTFAEIRDGTICGRTEGTLRFEDDGLVSKRHCIFTVLGNEVYIEEFGSTNPTEVNSVALHPHKRRRLRLNDVIEFGSQRLILTNQDKHTPGNAHDARKTPRIHKGLRTADGSLTSFFTGLITPQTGVIVGDLTYRRLQLKDALKPLRRRSALILKVIAASFAFFVVSVGGYYSLKNFLSISNINTGLSVFSCDSNPNLAYCKSSAGGKTPDRQSEREIGSIPAQPGAK